ncbi:hypothetical protein OROHE_025297 [Orobanche hederae]
MREELACGRPNTVPMEAAQQQLRASRLKQQPMCVLLLTLAHEEAS